MFDDFATEAYKQIKAGSWSRFRLTDQAEQLGLARPHLLLMEEEKEERAELGIEDATAQDVQNSLRSRLVDLARKVRCERATVWVVQTDEQRLWNIASTQLGNSIISLRFSHGLAGTAAAEGSDLLCNDTQNDARFNKQVRAPPPPPPSCVCAPPPPSAPPPQAMTPRPYVPPPVPQALPLAYPSGMAVPNDPTPVPLTFPLGTFPLTFPWAM
jgi:hypothetical protein